MSTYPAYRRKILDFSSLTALRQEARRAGRRVVQCHGCFDIVHPGHVRYLQFAKDQGDILLVSITGDPHVGKGEGRPYVPQELRAENLAALEFVDWVYINQAPTAVELLRSVQPEIYVKGREYEQNRHSGFLKERQAVESYAGRVIFSSGDVVYSSSHLIDTYAQQLDLHQEKLAAYCQRHQITRGLLEEFLTRLQGHPMVVVGDMMLERYQFCDGREIAPDGPMISLMPLESREFLGGSASIARHLEALGTRTALITSLGSDEESARILAGLQESGLDVRALRNRRRSVSRTRYLVDEQKLFLVDDSHGMPVDSAALSQMAGDLRALADPRGGLFCYDAGIGCITDLVMRDVLVPCRSLYGTLVATCGGVRGRLRRLSHVDLLVAAERDMHLAVGNPDQGLTAQAYELLSTTANRQMMVWLGPRNLLSLEHPGADSDERLRGEYVSLPQEPVLDPLDSLEALTAVAGALRVVGATLHQAAYGGFIAGLLAASQLGIHPIEAEQLRHCFLHRPELR